MTEREKTELLAYMVNELMRLDDDIIDRRNALYKHENYVSYHYELAESIIRQKAFKKFSQDVLSLLGLWFGESASLEDDYLNKKTED